MSQHIVMKENRKYVFGWDNPLQSFYLQVHHLHLPEDRRIVVWLGATKDTRMYEVEDLVQATREHGYGIPDEMQIMLHGEKDDGE